VCSICPRNAEFRQDVAHRQRRLLDQLDDLQLLGGGVSHASSFPAPIAVFFSNRFSNVSSGEIDRRVDRFALLRTLGDHFADSVLREHLRADAGRRRIAGRQSHHIIAPWRLRPPATLCPSCSSRRACGLGNRSIGPPPGATGLSRWLGGRGRSMVSTGREWHHRVESCRSRSVGGYRSSHAERQPSHIGGGTARSRQRVRVNHSIILDVKG
jgi:hypothetical protein